MRDFLLFSYRQAGGDHPRAPKQQQHQVQSAGQALHTEDPGPTHPEIHKSEKQQRQGGDQSSAGERKTPFNFLVSREKEKQGPALSSMPQPQQVFHIKAL